MADEQVRRVLANRKLIEDALTRGALTSRSAVSWARRGGAGEDISIVGALEGMPWLAEANKRVKAQSTSALVNQIVALLMQAVDGMPAPDDVDDEFSALFPPYVVPRTTLVYDQNDDGTRPPPRTVPDATMPPGYQYGTTSNVHQAYASAGRDRYDDADRITDDQADRLFPADGRAGPSAQAAAIARQEQREHDAAIRAGALDPYSDDDLLGLLFGDTT